VAYFFAVFGLDDFGLEDFGLAVFVLSGSPVTPSKPGGEYVRYTLEISISGY
jgi:hypothetical protein